MQTGWQTLGWGRQPTEHTPPHPHRPRDLARRRESVECPAKRSEATPLMRLPSRTLLGENRQVRWGTGPQQASDVLASA